MISIKLYDRIKSGVYTIAEMSANHGHSLDNALAIVHKAKDAGADCLKIQTYTADTMTIDSTKEDFMIKEGLWAGHSLYDLYNEASTPWEWQPIIKNECDKIGIDFLSTPFDSTSVDYLESLNIELYKVASFELVDIPLIRYIAGKGKPMIVSCGMGSIEEIREAVDVIKSEGLSEDKIILMKCTSAYPADISDMNLRAITDMKKRFGTLVGLSDHSMGEIAPVVATTLGARVVEKHFCLSREIKGPDSTFSMEPDEFKKMADAVDTAFKALGQVQYGVSSAESGNYNFRRSVYAIKDIDPGDRFTAENIKSIRPGLGLKPKYYDRILGQKSKSAYVRGEPIKESEL